MMIIRWLLDMIFFSSFFATSLFLIYTLSASVFDDDAYLAWKVIPFSASAITAKTSERLGLNLVGSFSIVATYKKRERKTRLKLLIYNARKKSKSI